jgi:hypothetical protein
MPVRNGKRVGVIERYIELMTLQDRLCFGVDFVVDYPSNEVQRTNEMFITVTSSQEMKLRVRRYRDILWSKRDVLRLNEAKLSFRSMVEVDIEGHEVSVIYLVSIYWLFLYCLGIGGSSS